MKFLQVYSDKYGSLQYKYLSPETLLRGSNELQAWVAEASPGDFYKNSYDEMIICQHNDSEIYDAVSE